jgi:hypothetical protein
MSERVGRVDRIDHERQQFFLAQDVAVERRRAGAERPGEAPHRQRFEALLVGNVDRGLDDPKDLATCSGRRSLEPGPDDLGRLPLVPKPADQRMHLVVHLVVQLLARLALHPARAPDLLDDRPATFAFVAIRAEWH